MLEVNLAPDGREYSFLGGGRRYISIPCLYCKNLFTTRYAKLKIGQGKYCSRACICRGRDTSGFRSSGRSRFGEANHNWKGGYRPIDYVRKFRAENPEKRLVQNRVYHAVKTGKLIRPDACSQCGKRCKPDAHHQDYSKPLEVTWVCRKCHVDIHHTGRRRITPKG
jgi:hypothetical protein